MTQRLKKKTIVFANLVATEAEVEVEIETETEIEPEVETEVETEVDRGRDRDSNSNKNRDRHCIKNKKKENTTTNSSKKNTIDRITKTICRKSSWCSETNRYYMSATKITNMTATSASIVNLVTPVHLDNTNKKRMFVWQTLESTTCQTPLTTREKTRFKNNDGNTDAKVDSGKTKDNNSYDNSNMLNPLLMM